MGARLPRLPRAPQPLLTDIRTKKALDDDLTGRLKAAIEAFKPMFIAG